MPNIVVRKAMPSDAKDIVEINIKGWQDTYKGIFPDSYLKKLNIDKEKHIEKYKEKIDKKGNFLVSLFDDKIVGFANYGLNKKNMNDSIGEIYAIYILSEYQKSGIGSKLFNQTINLLKDDYKNIIVSCLLENPSNLFYKKMGGKLIDNCEFVLENEKYTENVYEF